MIWPAFGGARLADLELDFERGIWGKMHAVPTDYRWIARSPGFPPPGSDIELRLLVGPESAPASASLWRAGQGAYLAAATYPSPARDAAGRSGFLEKQVCIFPRSAAVPAALAAFVLLRWVRERSFADWWQHRENPGWESPAFFLPIGADRAPASAGELEDRIRRGVGELEMLDPDALKKLYSGILSGRPDNLLESVKAPLSAEATAALLLPLPLEQADKLSVAGWSLSTRYRRQRREEVWNILVLDRVLRDEAENGPPSMSVTPAPEVHRRAEAIVEAILSGNPEGLLVAPVSQQIPGEVSSTIPEGPPSGEGAPSDELARTTDPSPPPSEMLTPPSEPLPAPTELSSSGETAPMSEVPRLTVPSPVDAGRPLQPAPPAEPSPLPLPPLAEAHAGVTSERSAGGSSDPWESLREEIEAEASFKHLEMYHGPLLKQLPEVIVKWVKYACSGEGFVEPERLSLPERWSPLASGDPAARVLRVALNRADELGGKPKAGLFRAAVLVLDGSVGPDEALKLSEEIIKQPHIGDPLMFLDRLSAEEQQALKLRLGDAWSKIPRRGRASRWLA